MVIVDLYINLHLVLILIKDLLERSAIRINTTTILQVAIESSHEDGAVEVKEPADARMEEDLESVAEPFVENLEDLEAKVVKRIVKSFVELPEVLRQLSKLYLKLAGKEAKLYLGLMPNKLIKLSN